VKRRGQSIRTRVARALWHASLFWGLAIGAAVWLALQVELDRLLDDSLQSSAEVLRLLQPADGLPALDALEGRFAWQVLDAEGRVLQRSAQAPAGAWHLPPEPGLQHVPGWHLYGVALRAPGTLLYLAQPQAERRLAQAEVALSAVLAAIAIGWLGHLWLRRRLGDELAPLQRLSSRLSRHEPLESMAASLGPPERAELAPVHAAIDDLASRLAGHVMQERAFSAHAAHALRTPLAGIDAQLALALREAPPELQPRLQRARDAAARLHRVVAALLALFRTADPPRREPVDLSAMLSRLPLDGLAVQVDPAITVDADPDLLAAALMNLLDNSLRHGGRRVVVSQPQAGTLRLHDDGPGVSAERRAALQAALAGQAYTGNTGLGLMLADLIARSHGGRLTLAPVSSGFAVDLTMDAGAPAASQ
jgi:signal transduction histidine kinase